MPLASSIAKAGGHTGTGSAGAAGAATTDNAKVFFMSPAVGEASKLPPSVVVKRATPSVILAEAIGSQSAPELLQRNTSPSGTAAVNVSDKVSSSAAPTPAILKPTDSFKRVEASSLVAERLSTDPPARDAWLADAPDVKETDWI